MLITTSKIRFYLTNIGISSHSAIADLVGWVKEHNPTMRNDNLIVELLQSLTLTK
jgi:hypothetical protein